MSSDDRLIVLRERNKELLRQLRERGERLQRLTSTRTVGPMGTRGSERPPELVTLIDGDRRPARTALTSAVPAEECKSNEIHTEVISSSDAVNQGDISVSPLNPEQGKGTVDVNSELVKEGNRRPVYQDKPEEMKRPFATSVLLDKREVGSRVTFQSPESGEMSLSESSTRRVQPLLGYDWIAGLLDVESSLTERSEEFFNDLRTFRAVNRDECVHSQQEEFPEADYSDVPPLTDDEVKQHNKDTHQCTYCYRINSRLFPIPLDPLECCPVCKKPKSLQPHTTAEPAFIRVSIPRSTLLPAYKYKSHRRCSFDPSDSMGLPSHCLSGWSNTGQNAAVQPSSLDLRSCLEAVAPTGLPMAQSLNKKHGDLSVSRAAGSQSSDQILDVSRLARYRFQHLAPKSKLYNTSYPVF